MPCCSLTIQPFVNETSTTVPYTGDEPTVTVSYLVDGVWQTLGLLTSVVLTAGTVVVDHGGASTGVIKLLQ
jgi:hypothetical protein